jgi:hypothetical protein
MSQLEVADNNATGDTQRASSAHVPPLRRTEGQPPPIAAHGGLSYMAFDRDGDAGTAMALQDALAEIADGESQHVINMLDKAPPGPISPRKAVWRCRCPIRSTSGRATPSSRPTLCGGIRRAPTSLRSFATTRAGSTPSPQSARLIAPKTGPHSRSRETMPRVLLRRLPLHAMPWDELREPAAR